MRPVGVIMMVVGVVWGIAGGGTPTGLLFFGGLGLAVYGWLRTRKQDQRLESSEQNITIKAAPRQTVLHRPRLESRPPPRASSRTFAKNWSRSRT